MAVRSGRTLAVQRMRLFLSYILSARLYVHATVLLAVYSIPVASAQTTRTGPSASSTAPTIPLSSSTGPNSPCGPFNPTSPCYSARTPRNPCYSAIAPNQPCSITTTPYHQASPTTAPQAPRTSSSQVLPTTSPLKPKRPSAVIHALTQDQAKAQIEAKGYSNVSGLRRDREEKWHGKADKDGQLRSVTLDRDGNVVEK